jgi:hypothetical protein
MNVTVQASGIEESVIANVNANVIVVVATVRARHCLAGMTEVVIVSVRHAMTIATHHHVTTVTLRR